MKRSSEIGTRKWGLPVTSSWDPFAQKRETVLKPFPVLYGGARCFALVDWGLLAGAF